MRIVISEIMSLDGVVQAPGGPGEDTDGGRMNELHKYVASRTLTQDDLDWNNSTLLPADDVVRAVCESSRPRTAVTSR